MFLEGIQSTSDNGTLREADIIHLLRLLENGVGESVIDITEPNDILQEGI